MDISYKGLPSYTLIVLLSLLLWGTQTTLGQHRVTGQVTDAATNNVLPGVNVVVEGTDIGTSTDENGEYAITAPSQEHSLQFSFIGYQTRSVNIRGRSEIAISLQREVIRGDELVVIGYGSRERRDVTGSLATFTEEDFNQGSIVTPEDLIEGKAAGVQVVRNSGEPGAGMSINIRGTGSINANNSPLYVIDGQPVTNENIATSTVTSKFTADPSPRNPLRTMSPQNIESITVLKDASATAIYGSRGANGVVIIETKHGQVGDLKVNYEGSVGTQRVANTLNLLGPEEYRSVLNGIIEDGGASPDLSVDAIEGGGTDWQDRIFKDNALNTEHTITASGGFGSEAHTTDYLVSLNYLNQDGIIINSSMERYSTRVNLNSSTEDFNFGLNLSGSATNDNFIANGFDLNERAGVVNAAINYDPSMQVKEGGQFLQSPSITIDNPLAIANGKSSWEDSYRVLGSVSGQYFFTSNLSAKLRAGTDILSQQRDTYIDRQTEDGRASGGIGTRNEGTRVEYEVDARLNYDREFGKHNLGLLLAGSGQRFIRNRSVIQGQGFPSDVTETFNFGLADPGSDDINSGKVSSSLVSSITRLSYDYSDTYSLTANFRIDGSSKFGDNNKYGYFPSVGVAWNIHEESFFESAQTLISRLKLRGSWGRSGNESIGFNQSIQTFGSGKTIAYDNEQVAANEPTRVPNPDLKWEVNEQTSVGVDYGLFRGKLSGTIEYYRRITSDLLMNLPVPWSTGFFSTVSNVGEIKNTGVEFSLSANNLNVGGLRINASANLTTLTNEVQELGDVPRILVGNPGKARDVAIITEGEPLYSFFGYEVEGIWQEGDDFSQTDANVQPGSMKYKDVNGDGSITADDRVILGDSFPDLQWAFNTDISYADFILNISIGGQEGVKMYNHNLAETYFPINFRRNRQAKPLLNRWTPENPSNKYPSFVNPLSQGQKNINSRTVEDASYIKLKNITLTYNLPDVINSVESASIYVSADNLFTLTDYSGYDPAINPAGNANFRIDWNAYPSTRSYGIGVRMSF